jgi:hypothetical protein
MDGAVADLLLGLDHQLHVADQDFLRRSLLLRQFTRSWNLDHRRPTAGLRRQTLADHGSAAAGMATRMPATSADTPSLVAHLANVARDTSSMISILACFFRSSSSFL